ETEVTQDLRAQSVVAETHGRMRFARSGLQPADESLPAVRWFHVEHDTASFARDAFERRRQRMVAAHAVPAKHVTEDVLAVHADERRFGADRSHRQCHVMAAIK